MIYPLAIFVTKLIYDLLEFVTKLFRSLLSVFITALSVLKICPLTLKAVLVSSQKLNVHYCCVAQVHREQKLCTVAAQALYCLVPITTQHTDIYVSRRKEQKTTKTM